MTVLVIDPKSEAAEGIQTLLEEQGHSCLVADDLIDADLTLRMARVDVMVLNLDGDAREALEWLQRLALSKPELASRSFLLTDHALDNVQLSIAMGCLTTVLRKPLRAEDLREAILNRRRDLPQSSDGAAGSGEAGRRRRKIEDEPEH